jgi:hypothetical protein
MSNIYKEHTYGGPFIFDGVWVCWVQGKVLHLHVKILVFDKVEYVSTSSQVKAMTLQLIIFTITKLHDSVKLYLCLLFFWQFYVFN